MNRRNASKFYMLALAAAVAAVALAAAPPDDRRRAAAAEEQYQRAQALEAALETKPKPSRTAGEYNRVVDSYRRVLSITPQAQFATPSLVAIGRLYEEMAEAFDPTYFEKAIATYQSLLKQYPLTRHGPEAYYALARIEGGSLGDPPEARKYLKELIRRYPSSDEADRARLDLAGSAPAGPAGRAPAAAAMKPVAPATEAAAHPVLTGEGGLESRRPAHILSITSEPRGAVTRITITLDGPVKYRSARVAQPERAYFDLSRAYLGKRGEDRLALDSSFVQSVHAAQNQPEVVRVVLDVSAQAACTASLLRNPYRLVIDVGSKPDLRAGLAKPESARAEAPAEAAGPATPPADMEAESRPGAVAGNSLQGASPGNRIDSETAAGSGAKAAIRSDARNGRNASAAPGADAPPSAPLPRSSDAIDLGDQPSAELAPTPRTPGPATAARPTRTGATSLTRELGLKIGRIVIDAGHGGFDTGTIGPTGLQEKDVCLDVAQRLGKLIARRLRGADVVYTRADDTFVPLETRTEVANEKQADLFISIHANSSPDPDARGIETYYLNFTTAPDAMAVAARENALSQEPVHQLQDLLKKISLNDKIQESREFAAEVDQALDRQLKSARVRERDRGVKKAPFVVLIGARMPSILTEISFLSNPTDEHLLKSPRYRQRIAQGLFDGIERYLGNLNSLTYNVAKSTPATAARK